MRMTARTSDSMNRKTRIQSRTSVERVVNTPPFQPLPPPGEGKKFVPLYPESFNHDADGNLTSDGRWTNRWDGENRLVPMETLAAVPTGGQKAFFRLLVPTVATVSAIAMVILSACNRVDGRVAAHARAETVGRLRTLISAFSSTLEDSELSLPPNVTNESPIVISGPIMMGIVSEYKDALPDFAATTNVNDNWGNGLNLAAVFRRYETNSKGVLGTIVAVRARSWGENRRDDDGKVDDLVVETEMQIPFVVIKPEKVKPSFETRQKSDH